MPGIILVSLKRVRETQNEKVSIMRNSRPPPSNTAGQSIDAFLF